MNREKEKFEVGDHVTVITRKPDGTVRGLEPLIFLAEVEGYFIVQGTEPGCKTPSDMMWFAKAGLTPLKVYPAEDCYGNRWDAERQVGKEVGTIEEQLARLFPPEDKEESGLLEDE